MKYSGRFGTDDLFRKTRYGRHLPEYFARAISSGRFRTEDLFRKIWYGRNLPEDAVRKKSSGRLAAGTEDFRRKIRYGRFLPEDLVQMINTAEHELGWRSELRSWRMASRARTPWALRNSPRGTAAVDAYYVFKRLCARYIYLSASALLYIYQHENIRTTSHSVAGVVVLGSVRRTYILSCLRCKAVSSCCFAWAQAMRD